MIEIIWAVLEYAGAWLVLSIFCTVIFCQIIELDKRRNGK